jgi:hypothetical protein
MHEVNLFAIATVGKGTLHAGHKCVLEVSLHIIS